MCEEQKNVYEYNSEYGGKYSVSPFLSMYVDNDNIYMGLNFYDEEWKCWESFGDVTVNIDKQPYLHAAIDTNNNGPKIMNFLEKNGFGEFTGLSAFSGFCAYPIIRFNEDKLREIDPEVFAQYAKAYGKDKSSLETKISDAKTRESVHTPDVAGKEPER